MCSFEQDSSSPVSCCRNIIAWLIWKINGRTRRENIRNKSSTSRPSSKSAYQRLWRFGHYLFQTPSVNIHRCKFYIKTIEESGRKFKSNEAQTASTHGRPKLLKISSKLEETLSEY